MSSHSPDFAPLLAPIAPLWTSENSLGFADCCAFSPLGGEIAVGDGWKGSIVWLRTETGELLARRDLQAQRSVRALAWLPVRRAAPVQSPAAPAAGAADPPAREGVLVCAMKPGGLVFLDRQGAEARVLGETAFDMSVPLVFLATESTSGLTAVASGRHLLCVDPQGKLVFSEQLQRGIGGIAWRPAPPPGAHPSDELPPLGATAPGTAMLLVASGSTLSGLDPSSGGLGVFSLTLRGGILSLASDPTGRWAVCGLREATPALLDLQRRQAHPLPGNATDVRCCAWGPTVPTHAQTAPHAPTTETWLACASGAEITLWTLTPEGIVSAPETLAHHFEGVTDLAFQPGGRLLASAGDDGMVIFWSAPQGRPVAFGHCPSPVGTLQWSPCGRRLIALTERSVVCWTEESIRAASTPPR